MVGSMVEWKVDKPAVNWDSKTAAHWALLMVAMRVEERVVWKVAKKV